MSLFEQLKRRNVFKAALLYIAAGWVLIQVVETIFPIFGISPAWVRFATILIFAGFPITLLVSWFYDLTPLGFVLDREIDHQRRPGADALDSRLPLDQQSIVVLPFADVSPDHDQEHLAEGLSEQLRSQLAKTTGLRVISRFSASAFDRRELSISNIAAALNVGNVLDGTVSRSEKQIRVTVQLVNADTDRMVWSEVYKCPLSDVFAVQDDISERVLRELQIRLVDLVESTRPTDPEAYLLYLQATHVVLRGSPESYSNAIHLLQDALEIDASYAPALGAMAEVIRHEVDDGLRDFKNGVEDARKMANRALKIDPSLVSARLELARIASHHDWDFKAAAAHLEAAGRGPRVLFRAADLAATLGNYETAISFGRQAVRHDPVSPWPYVNLANVLIVDDSWEEAEQILNRALELSPTFTKATWILARLRLSQGCAQEALGLAKALPIFEMQSHIRSMALFGIGDKPAADAELDSHIEKFGQSGASNIAEIYAYRGEAEAAFEWLERSFVLRDGNLANIRCNIELKKLYSNPRMADLWGRIGLADEMIEDISFERLR